MVFLNCKLLQLGDHGSQLPDIIAALGCGPVMPQAYVVSWAVTVEPDSGQGALETALDFLAAGEIRPRR